VLAGQSILMTVLTFIFGTKELAAVQLPVTTGTAIAGHREARDSDQPVVQSARGIGRGSHHHLLAESVGACAAGNGGSNNDARTVRVSQWDPSNAVPASI
jgi:hypothetical protein